MDDPELRKKKGEFGRQRVYNELAWEIVSRNLLDAYKYLLPNKVPANMKVSNKAS